MNREEAFRLLSSSGLDERLRAARFFERSAVPEDGALLYESLQSETVSWIQDALRRAIVRAAGRAIAAIPIESDEVAAPNYEDLLIRATQDVTGAIVHELEPLIGLLKLSAEDEVHNYSASKTRERIERLEALSIAVSNLRRASQPPSLQQFNLAEAIKTTTADVKDLNAELAGSLEVIVTGDRGLIGIAVTNALRNAIEATPADERSSSPIVVNWGKTDRDAWISVIDKGSGLRDRPDFLMKIGNSTKDQHFGMGLAIARTALISLGGNISLTAENPKGTKFEARWPQPREAAGDK